MKFVYLLVFNDSLVVLYHFCLCIKTDLKNLYCQQQYIFFTFLFQIELSLMNIKRILLSIGIKFKITLNM